MVSKIEDTFGITLPVMASCAARKNMSAIDYLKSEIVRYNAQEFADDSDKITPAWAEELYYEMADYTKKKGE